LQSRFDKYFRLCANVKKKNRQRNEEAVTEKPAQYKAKSM